MSFISSIIILLFSLNTYSQVQIKSNAGIIFLDDGQISTVKSYKDEKTYFNIQEYFFFPYQLKNINSHYFKDTSGKFYATNSEGFVFKYDSLDVGSGLFSQGSQFFTNSYAKIYVLKSDGIFVNYKSSEAMNFYNIKLSGGNYFINKEGKLFVIDNNGFIYDKSSEFKHTQKDIKYAGNNYFITRDSTLYTIGSIPTLDKSSVMAVVLSKKLDMNPSNLRIGGKFFFDATGALHTISIGGIHQATNPAPLINESLTSSDFEFLGSNYLVSRSNKLFMIDDNGAIHYILEMDKRVYKTDFKSK